MKKKFTQKQIAEMRKLFGVKNGKISFVDDLYQKLEIGLFVLVKSKVKQSYSMFSPFKDSFGNYKHSNWQNTQKEARQTIDNDYGFDKDNIIEFAEDDKWEIIKTYTFEDLLKLQNK